MRKIVLALGVSAILVYAGNNEVTAVVGGVHPLGSDRYDNHITYGIRGGVGLKNFIIDQLELGYDYSSGVKYENSESIDVHRLYFNAIKEYDISKSATVYALLGVGYQELSKDLPDEESGVFGQYGAGLKYYFTDHIALKTEVRHGIGFDSIHKGNLFYNLGLAYTFGEREQISTLVLEKTLFFAINSAEIPPSGESILQSIADELKAEENLNVAILIEGHADSTGSDIHNLQLSEKRAESVKHNLIEKGIFEDAITTKGFGETKPIKSNDTKEGRAANRRVEIIFVQ
ncbi:MAG: OmpA family protein [Campylobacteraceae bacterium]|jgi:OOP family OmpA-OmpF porin|nr:OmpA family protein [Campylobacteraceae bacterium]